MEEPMDIRVASDEWLVSQAQADDRNAYNTLLERYHSKVLQIIYFNVIDKAIVHDLTQEVLLKVHRYLPYFKQESKFSTWLYQITHNVIKNHYRTVSKRLESESQYVSEQNDTHTESPEDWVINLELEEKVESAVSELSDDMRDCYGKHTFEGQTYEEISKELNCPIGTVRSRIFRARKQLMNSISRS